MSGETALAALLAAAVLIGWARLAWSPIRVAPWRLAVLMLLNAAAAALLYATLLPPRIADRTGELVVATAGTPRLTALAAGQRLVLLPEVDDMPGGERAPDLATALRRNPGTGALRIVGTGLEARDRDAARGLGVAFDSPRLPRGLVGLYPPEDPVAGAAFQIGVTVAGIGEGSVELLDPAGRLVDRVEPGTDGRALLGGTARAAGAALFGVRVRDASRTIVSEATVPVVTRASPQTRMLIVAGAPGPEVKFLRRWATDAGLATVLRASLGGGARIGDGGAITPASLSRIDVAVFDDRGWAGLSGAERAAIAGAVRGGMGALLRVTGPLSPTIRGQWRAMGLDVAGGQGSAVVTLAPAGPNEAALQARRGPGTGDVPPSAAGEREDLPALTRRVAALAGAAAVLRDAKGATLAGWRPSGRGRVGAWLVEDSFGLVTAGHGDRYGEWWSRIVSVLARPDARIVVETDPLPRQGERLALCGLPAGEVGMTDPQGARVSLLRDPAAAGCAGYWPTRSGWHQLVGGNGLSQPIYVQPHDALPGVRAAERVEATRRLVGVGGGSGAIAREGPRGAAWPWFLGWLAAVAACWWLERSRLGRRPEVAVPD